MKAFAKRRRSSIGPQIPTLIVGILLYVVCFAPIVNAQNRVIRMGEGTFEDWDTVVTRVADAANDVPGIHNDFYMLWVTHDSEFLYARFDGDFGKRHNMAINLDIENPDNGSIVAKAWVIKRGATITLEIEDGRRRRQSVSNGFVEYFPQSSGRQLETIHVAWPLDQLGLASDSVVALRAESHASHSTASAVKDRVPDAPLKLAYDFATGTWRPYQPGFTFRLNFSVEPSDVMFDQPITPGVVVELTNESGQVLPIGGVPVEMLLATGTGNLVGSSREFTNEMGQATFDDLRFDSHGEKQLKAVAVRLEEAISRPFTVLAPELVASELIVISETGYPSDTASRGETITYAIDIENTGTMSVRPIVTGPVPNGTVYVAGSSRVAIGEGELVAIDDVAPGESPFAHGRTLPEIRPGEQARVSFQVTVDSANEIGYEIIGTAIVSDGLRMIELNAVTTVLAPQIHVMTATDATSVVPGEPFTFQITVANTSAVDARNVQVASAVPPGMSYIPRSAKAPVGTSIRYQEAKTGDWTTSEPDEVATVLWVLEVVKAGSQEIVSMQLMTH